MTNPTNGIPQLLAELDDLEQQRDALSNRINLLANQLRYLQLQQWTQRTGLKIGDELTATSSFMKEIDRRRTSGAFSEWTWTARYFLNSVDLDREITCSVLCMNGGMTGIIPEWVVVEMRERFTASHG